MITAYKQLVLAIDDGATIKQEPYEWTPGRTGTRWFVYDGKGNRIGRGDPGSPMTAWRGAYRTLKEREN